MDNQILMPGLHVFTVEDDTLAVIDQFNGLEYVLLDEARKAFLARREQFLLVEDRVEVAMKQAMLDIHRRLDSFGKFPDMSGVELGSDPKAIEKDIRARRAFLSTPIYKPAEIGALAGWLETVASKVIINFSFPKAIEKEVRFRLPELGALINEPYFRPIKYGARKADATSRRACSGYVDFPAPPALNIIPEPFLPESGAFEVKDGRIRINNWRLAIGVAIMLKWPIQTCKTLTVDYEDEQPSIFETEAA